MSNYMYTFHQASFELLIYARPVAKIELPYREYSPGDLINIAEYSKTRNHHSGRTLTFKLVESRKHFRLWSFKYVSLCTLRFVQFSPNRSTN